MLLNIYLGKSFYITTTPRLVIVAIYYQLNSVEIVAKISILSQSILLVTQGDSLITTTRVGYSDVC